MCINYQWSGKPCCVNKQAHTDKTVVIYAEIYTVYLACTVGGSLVLE